MTVPYPHFEVNCKVYPGTGGEAGRAFAGDRESLLREIGQVVAAVDADG